MVVVNLYPFAETIAREGVSREEAIEQIDIGGPAMIRSAAKNGRDVAVVTAPAQYEKLIIELRQNDGSLSPATHEWLTHAAFRQTARYDSIVSGYLGGGDLFPVFDQSVDLRYGENPHQSATLYQASADGGVANAELLSGKEMSFNNYVDADAAWQLVCDFEATTCAIIKHTNPAGVGQGETVAVAYQKALATDPVSAFGGIVAINRPADAVAAREIAKIFTEVVIAPGYDSDALQILQAKKNLRVLRMESVEPAKGPEYKQISGGMLVQTRDSHKLKREDLKFVSARQPTDDEIRALLFAWTVCKHTKSNAIVYARDGQTVGVGAGQMSRVDSVRIGAMRAQLPVAGSVLASDAFFPFRDGLDEAARNGITAVIQPGGSVRDDEVIAAANEHGLAMVFTGVRHFKH
jgi:phosphoribosylaminoimidazolecarboxamide formyltransferase/IMP cyclohydrolase